MSTGSWGTQEPQGPDWYQASDGLWYPPGGGGAVVPQAGGLATTGGPVEVGLDAPPKIDRWRPLVAWLLVIPHYFVMIVVALVAYVAQIVAFFSILFTRQVPPWAHEWIVRLYRYQWQIMTYSLFMHEDYPPWMGTEGEIDPGTERARLTIRRADELQRFAPLYKWFLAIPHYFVLAILGIGVYFAILIAFFAVLFTGKWPEGLRDFVVNFFRWATRVNAYVLLRDEYPPFSLD